MNKLELLELTSKLISETGMSMSNLIAESRLLERYINSQNNTAPLTVPSFKDFCSDLKAQNPIHGIIQLEYRYFYDDIYSKIKNDREVIIENDRQVGISTFWAVLSLYKLIFNSNHKILYISKIKNGFMDKLKFILESSPYFDKVGIKQYNSNMIEFDNGSQIFIKSSQESFLRGMTINELIIDDADFINYNTYLQIIESYTPTIFPLGGKLLMSSFYSGNEESLFYKRFKGNESSVKIDRV